MLPPLRREDRLRLALEEGGGLFALFGQYLSRRSDLLPRSYVHQFSKIRLRKRASPSSLLNRRFASGLSEFEWICTTPYTEVYQAIYQGSPVIMEFFLPDSCQSQGEVWDRFAREMQFLSRGPESAVARQSVLEQFREWLQMQADLDRKRTILNNLQDGPRIGITQFPRLIPELQSATCLAYERLEGRPLGEGGVLAGGSEDLKVFVEGLLERTLLFSLVDVDVQLENFVLLANGAIGFRAVPTFAGVPVDGYYEMLHFVAATVAGDIPRATRMLSRLVAGADALSAAQEIMAKLSALQPELDSKVQTGSTIFFENFGRALAATALQPPLFLQFFQRNLAFARQQQESTDCGDDLVRESLWPVLGRVLRYHVDDLLATPKGQEWMMSSLLLFLSALQQVEVAMERTRETENALAQVVERKQKEFYQEKRNRRTAALIRTVMMLAVFFVAMQLLINVENSLLQAISGTAAAILAFAIFRVISRME